MIEERAIVEDDFPIQVVGNGWNALRALAEGPVQLFLLDIVLPDDLAGLPLRCRARPLSATPIIIAMAAEQPEMGADAQEAGDNYVTTPLHSQELIGRLRAVLRSDARYGGPTVVQAGDLTIDLQRREVRRGTQPVRLTKTEFELLRALVTHTDQVQTYKDLLETVWGPGCGDLHAIHVHMSHLRRKLEGKQGGPRCLLAVPGVGYRFHIPDR